MFPYRNGRATEFICGAGFKARDRDVRRGGLHKTEIDSSDFIEAFVPLKFRKVTFYF
jgi:hypothetical protein